MVRYQGTYVHDWEIVWLKLLLNRIKIAKSLSIEQEKKFLAKNFEFLSQSHSIDLTKVLPQSACFVIYIQLHKPTVYNNYFKHQQVPLQLSQLATL